jgi:hypothetical protein
MDRLEVGKQRDAPQDVHVNHAASSYPSADMRASIESSGAAHDSGRIALWTNSDDRRHRLTAPRVSPGRRVELTPGVHRVHPRPALSRHDMSHSGRFLSNRPGGSAAISARG